MKYSHGKVSNKAKFEAFKKLRRGLKKTDYFMTLIKRVGGYLAEIATS